MRKNYTGKMFLFQNSLFRIKMWDYERHCYICENTQLPKGYYQYHLFTQQFLDSNKLFEKMPKVMRAFYGV